VGISPGSETVRGVSEVGLKDRLENQDGSHLHDSISHRWDTQRTFTATGFWNHHTSHRLRLVALLAQLRVELVHERCRATCLALDVRDAYTVHSRGAAVTGDPEPSYLKHVAPIDPVIQCVEPELRLLLRLPV
jgi:hypothetical protein